MRRTDKIDGTGQQREARHVKRHERDTTIDGTIGSTIGCLIMNVIFPPHRHVMTGSGDVGTKDEQGQTARGTGIGMLDSDAAIRLPWKCFRLEDMYISCIPLSLPAAPYAIVVYSIR